MNVQTLEMLTNTYMYMIRVFIIERELTDKHNEVELAHYYQCIQ